MVTDITKRKQVEQALLTSQARIQEILDNSLDLAYRLDLVTVEADDYFSPSVVQLTGLSVHTA